METKTKHPQIFFRLETELLRKLDRRIQRAGYSSRTEFFTAVAYAALYGTGKSRHNQKTGETPQISSPYDAGADKLPKNISAWLEQTMPEISEEQIRQTLHQTIEEMLIPVIAMKGADVAFEKTWEDVRDLFHEKTGIWATESEIREAYLSFEALNKSMLDEYRRQQLNPAAQEGVASHNESPHADHGDLRP